MNTINILKEHENVISSKYHVTRIGIFGSFARGEGKEDSDVDILL